MRLGAECTASLQVRTWTAAAWGASRGECPDCGRSVAVSVGARLFPRALASKHRAPAGVTAGPYAARPIGGATDGMFVVAVVNSAIGGGSSYVARSENSGQWGAEVRRTAWTLVARERADEFDRDGAEEVAAAVRAEYPTAEVRPAVAG